MELTNLSVIRSLCEKYGFGFSKTLGQNFLVNAAIPPKIAKEAEIDGKFVVEIGPGFGCLTKELCKRAKKVVAVEIDSSLLPVLKETLAEFDNLEIINDDILNVDLSALCEKYGEKSVYICANLPYYITTPIVMHLLESEAPVKSVTVMVQKELARRFVSSPGSPDYSAVTASVAYYTNPKLLFGVSAGSFYPAPKVDSAVIRLDVIPENERIPVKDRETFFKVIRAAFAMRRKTLVNNLSSGFAITKSEAAEILSSLSIPVSARGETLGIEDFARISDKIEEKRISAL
ncbi:MAG: 16S rRNA (adenine(1518)-N(6)/adenine(1519)-N(6))-dimethyltransferase RsmA [Clostridia bacterium]|nr:16S rRNA (adenine(1518)-N(6)/adenine(1519)-N(6))-dimethyltransferase RsmA [Clostridia bacterium]